MANNEAQNETSKDSPQDESSNSTVKIHPVFEAIRASSQENVVDAVRNFFEVDGVSLEIMDNTGMTPLMHSCWKGNLDLAKFLIKQVSLRVRSIKRLSCDRACNLQIDLSFFLSNQGADVNGGDHEHGYTPLHFSALAGMLFEMMLLDVSQKRICLYYVLN